MSNRPLSHTMSRRWIAPAAIAAAVLAATGAWAATTTDITRFDRPAEPAKVDAAQLFADAPDGVDPVVTGPASAGLKQRQADLNCAAAKWPHVPVACYPD